MRVRVANLSEHGVILDRKDFSLPQNAFSYARNMQFHDGAVRKSAGAVELLAGLTLRPEWLTPYGDPESNNFYWVYAGLQDNDRASISVWDGTTDARYGKRNTANRAINGPLASAQVNYGSHPAQVGDWVYLDTSTDVPPIPDGWYQVDSIVDPNKFTINAASTAAVSTANVGLVIPLAKISGIGWTGGDLNGLLVVNSGGDTPQKWDRTADILNDQFEDLANWPAGDVCSVLRPFRNFLVALDVTKSGALRNPYLVRWSDAAAPFTEPAAWDAAPGNLAGEFTMSEDGGYIIDALPLRGALIIYRQNQTYIMRYTEGSDVMSVDKLFGEFGLLSTRCVKPFGDGNHFVVSPGNIYVHNGNTARSIATQRVQHEIFNEIDEDNYLNSFVTPNYNGNEMWFCYPTTGNSIPNKVAKWNWEANVWSFDEFDGLAHIGYGVIPGGGAGTWDADTGQWDSDTSTWTSGNANPTVSQQIIAYRDTSNLPTSDTEANSKLLQSGGNQFDGNDMNVRLERTGLTGITAGGGAVQDPTIDKQLQAIWPTITGGPVSVSVGASDSPGGPYTWDGPTSFDPLTDQKIDVRVSGKYYGVRFESYDNISWNLDEFVIELEAEGER